jgi:AcrR family transcriptional regulator
MKSMAKTPETPVTAPDGAASPGELPPSLELAWGLRDAGTRGPKRGLTLAQITAAGMKLARAEGVGALSMAHIARELGVGTMSLYRYVAAKEELLMLMVDTALGTPPPAPPGEEWRAGLRRWSVGVWEAYQRNPWALRVPIGGPPSGPNNVAWLDNGLQALSGTSLPEQDNLSTVLLLSGFVRNTATLVADLTESAAGGTVMPGYGQMITRLTSAEQFPALHRAIASGSLDDDDDIEVELEFGLERILDGIAVLIERTDGA